MTAETAIKIILIALALTLIIEWIWITTREDKNDDIIDDLDV